MTRTKGAELNSRASPHDSGGVSRGRIAVALLTIITALVASLVAAFVVHRAQTSRQELERDRAIAAASARVAAIMDLHMGTVAGLQGLFEASEGVTEREFTAYTRFAFNDPALDALSLHEAVPSAAVPAWTRRNGLPIVDLEGKRVAAARPAIHYVIKYIASARPDHMGKGFDSNSDPLRSRAISAAVALDAPQATLPVTLASSHQPGVVIYAPVRGLHPGHPELVDVVSAMVGTTELASEVTSVLPSGSRVHITDDGRLVAGEALPGGGAHRRLSVAGRLWDIHIQLPAAGGDITALAIAGGGITAALMGLWVLLLTIRRQRYTMQQLDLQTEARDRAESGLRASENHLRTLVSDVPTGLFTIDGEGRVVTANPAWCALTGRDGDGLAGVHWSDMVAPDDHDRAAESIAAGESAVFRIRRPSGDVRWVNCSMSPTYGADGEVSGAIGFMADVTDRRTEQLRIARSEERMRSIVGAMTDAIVVTDGDGTILWSNPAAQAVFGYDDVELLSMAIGGLFAEEGADDPDFFADRLAAHGLLAGDLGFAIRGRGADGREIPLEVRVQPHALGESEGFTVVLRDLTQHVESERAAEQRALEQEALRSLATLVAQQVSVEAAAAATIEKAGWTARATYAMVVEFTLPDHGELRAVWPSAGGTTLDVGDELRLHDCVPLEALRDHGVAQHVWDGEAWWLRSPLPSLGTTLALPIIVDDVVWGALVVACGPHVSVIDTEALMEHFASLLGMAVSAAEQRAQLARLASTDDLTGLANRRAFTRQLEVEIERARRYARPLSLVLFDLDHFKAVNDTHGHAVGDQVLTAVANRVGRGVRAGEMLARVGGEEFAWILPEADSQGASRAAERALEALRGTTHGAAGIVTASMGVAQLAGPEDDLSMLYRRADDALYEAKAGGRDRYRVAPPPSPEAATPPDPTATASRPPGPPAAH